MAVTRKLCMNPRAEGLHRLLGVFYIQEGGDLGKTDNGHAIHSRSRAVSENDLTFIVQHWNGGWYDEGEYRDPLTAIAVYEERHARWKTRLAVTHPDCPTPLVVAK